MKLLDFFIQTTGLPVPTLLLCFNVNDLHNFAMVLISSSYLVVAHISSSYLSSSISKL